MRKELTESCDFLFRKEVAEKKKNNMIKYYLSKIKAGYRGIAKSLIKFDIDEIVNTNGYVC
jgi:hypothetical protein